MRRPTGTAREKRENFESVLFNTHKNLDGESGKVLTLGKKEKKGRRRNDHREKSRRDAQTMDIPRKDEWLTNETKKWTRGSVRRAEVLALYRMDED